MISRREFVQTAALATAATAVPRSLRALPGEARLDRVGLQLYTVRSEMVKSVESTLERVAAIGYKEVEFAGYFNRGPGKLRETLDRLGLVAPSTHLGLGVLENQWDATAA